MYTIEDTHIIHIDNVYDHLYVCICLYHVQNGDGQETETFVENLKSNHQQVVEADHHISYNKEPVIHYFYFFHQESVLIPQKHYSFYWYRIESYNIRFHLLTRRPVCAET